MSQEPEVRIEFGKPVRFLALEWREPWEFDHPSVLLEPVFRYSPNGKYLDSLIEDAATDIAINIERGEPNRAGISSCGQKEFDWRGWDVTDLRAKAEAALRGEKVKLGTGHVGVLEYWVVFHLTADGEVRFEYVVPPGMEGVAHE